MLGANELASMKIRLLTQHSEEYLPLADLTLPGKSEYCHRWGYELVVDPLHPPLSCWQRPEAWRRHLDGCDWLFFTGTDVMITNHTIDVRDLCAQDKDFIFAADGNGLQSDVMLFRACPAVADFLDRVRLHEGRGTNNEQDALSIELSGSRDYMEYCCRVGDLRVGGEPPGELLLTKLQAHLTRSAVRVGIVPQRKFNAYPHTLYGGTGWEPHSWRTGDFICHIPGKKNDVRIEFFKGVEVVR